MLILNIILTAILTTFEEPCIQLSRFFDLIKTVFTLLNVKILDTKRNIFV